MIFTLATSPNSQLDFVCMCVCVCVWEKKCATIWSCYVISVWIVVKLWLEWTKNLLLLPKSRCVKIWPKYCIQKMEPAFFFSSSQAHKLHVQIDLANKQIRRTHVLILLTNKISNLCTWLFFMKKSSTPSLPRPQTIPLE